MSNYVGILRRKYVYKICSLNGSLAPLLLRENAKPHMDKFTLKFDQNNKGYSIKIIRVIHHIHAEFV